MFGIKKKDLTKLKIYDILRLTKSEVLKQKILNKRRKQHE